MIRTFFAACAFFGASLFATQSNGSSTQAEPSKMHKAQLNHVDSLSREQRNLMYQLSPKYQRIYLNVLTEDERDKVADRYRKGENPYKAIDYILEKDRKKNFSSCKGRGGRSARVSRRNNTYVKVKQDPIEDEDSYVYEQEKSPVQLEEEKPTKKSYSSTKKKDQSNVQVRQAQSTCIQHCKCSSCCKKEAQRKVSFSQRCKNYFTKTCKKKSCCKKKYTYKEPTRKPCRCKSK